MFSSQEIERREARCTVISDPRSRESFVFFQYISHSQFIFSSHSSTPSKRKKKKTFDVATLKTPGPFCFPNKLMNEGILALGSENCCSNDSVPCLMPLTITGVLVSVAIGTLLATFFVSQGFVVSAHECQKKSSLDPPRRPLC